MLSSYFQILKPKFPTVWQQPQTTASLQTLPHHYANFANLSSSSRRSGLNHQQQEHQAASIVPDIIQQAASDSEAEVNNNLFCSILLFLKHSGISI